MPLSYQPFAEIPAVDDLQRDLRMNVSEPERLASSIAGTALVGLSFGRHGLIKWALVGLGAALIQRAWTGHCAWYQHLQRDRHHPASGVPGNSGIRVEQSIDIRCPSDVLYRFWRNLEELPRVMRHVKSVECLPNQQSHWRVTGPLGQTIEWDAEIINAHEGRLIAWQSLPGAKVRNAGSVWFEPKVAGTTRVKVAFEYDPPAGAIGALLAALLGASPERDLSEDLGRFKVFAERELTVPVAA